MTFEERIRALCASITGRQIERDDLDLERDYALDSLDLFELRVGIESALGISITDEDWSSCRTVRDICLLIKGTRGATTTE